MFPTRLLHLPLLFSICVGPAVLLSGCESTEPDRSPGIDHAVYSARLRGTMRQASLLASERLATELSPESREINRERIRTIALDLSRSAGGIKAAVEQLDLPPSETLEFARLADQMKTQSLEMHEQARASSIEELERQVQGLVETCSACHALYRLPPDVTGL